MANLPAKWMAPEPESLKDIILWEIWCGMVDASSQSYLTSIIIVMQRLTKDHLVQWSYDKGDLLGDFYPLLMQCSI